MGKLQGQDGLGGAKGLEKRGLSFASLHVKVSAVHREVKVFQCTQLHVYRHTCRKKVKLKSNMG